MKITPHGTLHRLSNGQNLMTAFVDGVAFDQVNARCDLLGRLARAAWQSSRPAVMSFIR
jgi:hypothetical protein